MTEMFGKAWPPMSVPDLAPDDDDDDDIIYLNIKKLSIILPNLVIYLFLF